VVLGVHLPEHGIAAGVPERGLGVGLEPVDNATHVGLPVHADAVDYLWVVLFMDRMKQDILA
jgi:hypothetical protein